MRILFTGIGRRVELVQAFREAALVLDKDLKIYGADMITSASSLSYCDYVRIVVSMKDPSYIDGLLRICQRDSIDLVIPTIDTDLTVLSENRKKFEAIGTRVMISDPETVRICRDKQLTAAFFAQCGLHTPTTVSNWKEYSFGFPAFIKPRSGSSSINAFRVDREENLKFYAEKISDCIIQPYISGREYTIDVFCDWNGTPLSIVPRERLQVRSGEVLKTRICLDPAMIEETRRVCDALKPCGAMTVQLIRDGNGVDWFIEINSRFGGGSPLSMKAGARSAEMILKLLDCEPAESPETIADGATYSRFDQSVCIEAGKGKIKGVVFDLDDTLYSEKEYVRSGYRAVSDFLGGGYEERLWTLFEERKPAIDCLLNELGREEEKAEAVAVYRSHKPDIHLYPGVAELLKELKENKIKTGIITDGRPEGQRNKIAALGLENLVDDMIVTDELGGPQFRKPCDIAFRIIQRRWKLSPSEIVYIGDNPAKDVPGAKQIGMRSICFMNGDGVYAGTDAGVRAGVPCVDSVAELREKLL